MTAATSTHTLSFAFPLQLRAPTRDDARPARANTDFHHHLPQQGTEKNLALRNTCPPTSIPIPTPPSPVHAGRCDTYSASRKPNATWLTSDLSGMAAAMP